MSIRGSDPQDLHSLVCENIAAVCSCSSNSVARASLASIIVRRGLGSALSDGAEKGFKAALVSSCG